MVLTIQDSIRDGTRMIKAHDFQQKKIRKKTVCLDEWAIRRTLQLFKFSHVTGFELNKKNIVMFKQPYRHKKYLTQI